MDIGLAVAFIGFFVTNLIFLWSVSNRICDKIENIGKDVAILRELSGPHQTVNFKLNQSGLTGTIQTRPDEFTSNRTAYSVVLSERVGSGVTQKAVSKMEYGKVVLSAVSGQVILLKIQSLDVDENASIIESFLHALDAEIYVDNSKNIAGAIEEKLRLSLGEGAP